MKHIAALVFLVAFLLLVPVSCYSECIEGDCENGTGTFTQADGSEYTGAWKEDQQHGYGVLTVPGHDPLEGFWERDFYVGTELPKEELPER